MVMEGIGGTGAANVGVNNPKKSVTFDNAKPNAMTSMVDMVGLHLVVWACS